MSERKVYHVVYDDDMWKVKLEGSGKSSANCENKQEAIDVARGFAKNAELGQIKIHKKDGPIETEYTYGKDPRNILG